MGKPLRVGVFKNKKNGQINFSLPKKKMSKKMLLDIGKAKTIKISIEKIYT